MPVGQACLRLVRNRVVALVAEDLSNREVAQELGLSENTIKKYLFRIFDKLGISTRVELVLYAVSHGDHRPAEWLPAVSERRQLGLALMDTRNSVALCLQ